MSERIFFIGLLVLIITYGVGLGYIAERAYEECGGLDKCIDEAFSEKSSEDSGNG